MEENENNPTGDDAPIRKRRKIIVEEEELSVEDLDKMKKLENFFIQRIAKRRKEWLKILGGILFQIISKLILSVALIFAAIENHKYSYYANLRWWVFAFCILCAILYLIVKLKPMAIISLVIAIVFNPIFTFKMGRFSWQIVDISVSIIFALAIVMDILVIIVSTRNKNENNKGDVWLFNNGSALIYGSGGVSIVRHKVEKDNSISSKQKKVIEQIIHEISTPKNE